ncbi:PspA-associated protein PspAA, partial [Streptomyces purpurascens]
MIMRILGEGQYEITEDHLDRLNELDAALQSAADADDDTLFATV